MDCLLFTINRKVDPTKGKDGKLIRGDEGINCVVKEVQGIYIRKES